MTEKNKKVGMNLYPGLIIHRILRVWPTYAICLLIYWKISIFMGSVMTYYIILYHIILYYIKLILF